MSDDFLELDNDLDAIETAREGVSGEAPAANRQPKVNLNDFPEYRDYQAANDRDKARLAAQVKANEERAAKLEQQLHQINMQGLDEIGKLQYELDLTRQSWQEERNLRERERLAIQRQRDLEDIHLATGLPLADLEAVDPSVHVHEIWRVATKLASQQPQRKVAAPPASVFDEPVPNDTVDISPGRGGGTSQERMQQLYDKHRKLFNMDKLMEIEAEATRRGITLREW